MEYRGGLGTPSPSSPGAAGYRQGSSHLLLASFLPAALAVRFLTRRFIGEYASNAGEQRRAPGTGSGRPSGRGASGAAERLTYRGGGRECSCTQLFGNIEVLAYLSARPGGQTSALKAREGEPGICAGIASNFSLVTRWS